jgi:hypothetical protein
VLLFADIMVPIVGVLLIWTVASTLVWSGATPSVVSVKESTVWKGPVRLKRRVLSGYMWAIPVWGTTCEITDRHLVLEPPLKLTASMGFYLDRDTTRVELVHDPSTRRLAKVISVRTNVGPIIELLIVGKNVSEVADALGLTGWRSQ